MREWLITLIREAVRAEVEHNFRALQDKTALLEASLAGLRVKDKHEARPSLSRQWGAVSRRLEDGSEGKQR